MMMQANVAMNETRKGLLIMWDYRFSTIMEFFMIGMVFSGVMLLVGQGELEAENLSSALFGFLITFYAMETISRMSWALMAEAQAGTLEQMYMSPASSASFLLGRAFASFAMATVSLIIMTPVLIVLFNIEFSMPPEGLLVILITLIGFIGFGFMVAGLTIIFKQVGPLANMLQNMLLFINGTFLPIEKMPNWLETFAKFLPSTQGIVVLRKIALDGASLSALWSDGSLIFLMVHSVVFLLIGWGIFVMCERVARQTGSLGHY